MSVNAKNDQIKIHYEGFASRHDEWISSTSDRVKDSGQVILSYSRLTLHRPCTTTVALSLLLFGWRVWKTDTFA